MDTPTTSTDCCGRDCAKVQFSILDIIYIVNCSEVEFRKGAALRHNRLVLGWVRWMANWVKRGMNQDGRWILSLYVSFSVIREDQ